MLADGKCQCRKDNHGHDKRRCNRTLYFDEFQRDNQRGWNAHYINRRGGDGVDNCEILCRNCHQLTFKSGKKDNL